MKGNYIRMPRDDVRLVGAMVRKEFFVGGMLRVVVRMQNANDRLLRAVIRMEKAVVRSVGVVVGMLHAVVGMLRAIDFDWK